MDALIFDGSAREGVLMGPSEQALGGVPGHAVETVRAGGKTIAEVARDSRINDTMLGNWLRADNADPGVRDNNSVLGSTPNERALGVLTRHRRRPQQGQIGSSDLSVVAATRR